MPIKGLELIESHWSKKCLRLCEGKPIVDSVGSNDYEFESLFFPFASLVYIQGKS